MVRHRARDSLVIDLDAQTFPMTAPLMIPGVPEKLQRLVVLHDGFRLRRKRGGSKGKSGKMLPTANIIAEIWPVSHPICQAMFRIPAAPPLKSKYGAK